MKKLLILAALLSAVQAEGTVGSKAYIEMGLGFTNMYGGVRGLSDNQPFTPVANRTTPFFQYETNNIKSGWGGTQFSSAVSMGYDCKMRDSLVVMGMYAGGGYSGGLYKAPYDGVYSSKPTALGNYASSAQTFNISFREKGRIGVGFRMGLAAGSFLPYVRLGWAMHFMGAQIKRPNADTLALEKYNVSKGVSALTVGCGVDYQVTNSFIMGAVFDMSFGQKAKFNFAKKNILWAPGKIDQTLSARLKPTFSTFLVTAKWAFPTCN
jgi:opacity protein-like surface antigen